MADFNFIDELGTLPSLKEVENKLIAMQTFSGASSILKESLHLYAATIAKEMSAEVTSTQLRRFYTYIKSMELVNRGKPGNSSDITDKYKLNFILPKMAGSSEAKKLTALYKVLTVCLSNENGGKIKTLQDLRLFVEFFEAILDYHASQPKKTSNSNKNHGGKK